jgi:molybdopterin molybdotransferase
MHSSDIRMKGFQGSVDLATAQKVLADRIRPLEPETIPVTEALGRVLARPVVATFSVPPFAKAAVDGYAVRAEDTFGAGPFDPVELAVAFEVMPGKMPPRPLGRGEAVRIMTGAPVPEGTDAVVMVEHAEESAGRVRLVQALAPGKNVAPRGEDVTEGDVIAPAGRKLRAEDLGVLASIRERTVSVHRRPSVHLWSSGNEVMDPLSDEPTREGAIFDANSYVLEALSASEGALARRGGILRDDRAAISAALGAARADVTITSGAASVGKEDYMPLLVRELGELWVHGVSIRPAHPVGFGRIGDRLHFLLPGNPVAAWIAFRVFVGPALRLLSGRSVAEAFRPERTRRAILARKILSVAGRTDFMRVRFNADGTVEPLRTGGAGILTSVTRADGIVVVAKELEGLEAGTEVEVELL